MIRLQFLKGRVIKNLSVLPSSERTLAAVLNKPEWQIHYAIKSLVADGIVVASGKLWKLREQESRARKHV